MYITVSTNSHGLEGRENVTGLIPPNLLIISGGGRGHIPIPIFMSEVRPEEFPISDRYDYEAVFLGTLKTHKVRRIMVDFYRSELGRGWYHPRRADWKKAYERARFVMCPRGFGRGSYRLTEALQSGRVIVYIYNDIIWLPYFDSINWSSFSIIARYDELNQTLDRIRGTPDSEIVKMRQRIWELYDSHWTVAAVFNHIRRFMIGGFASSDLRCAEFANHNGLNIP